jgi:DNA-binding transcriptional ArsR family regulator
LTYISDTLYLGAVHAFDVLGDPVRRRILELLADGELSSGKITATVQAEFGISQPAVSQHLKVLRESGFASVRPEGTRRLYAVDSAPLQEVDVWLDRFRIFWEQRLDSLATELARGKRERRLAADPTAATTPKTPKEDPSDGRRQT